MRGVRRMYVCRYGRPVRKHHPNVQFCPSLCKYPVVAARATRAPNFFSLLSSLSFLFSLSAVVGDRAASVRGMYVASPTRGSHCAGHGTMRARASSRWSILRTASRVSQARSSRVPPYAAQRDGPAARRRPAPAECPLPPAARPSPPHSPPHPCGRGRRAAGVQGGRGDGRRHRDR